MTRWKLLVASGALLSVGGLWWAAAPSGVAPTPEAAAPEAGAAAADCLTAEAAEPAEEGAPTAAAFVDPPCTAGDAEPVSGTPRP